MLAGGLPFRFRPPVDVQTFIGAGPHAGCFGEEKVGERHRLHLRVVDDAERITTLGVVAVSLIDDTLLALSVVPTEDVLEDGAHDHPTDFAEVRSAKEDPDLLRRVETLGDHRVPLLEACGKLRIGPPSQVLLAVVEDFFPEPLLRTQALELFELAER